MVCLYSHLCPSRVSRGGCQMVCGICVACKVCGAQLYDVGCRCKGGCNCGNLRMVGPDSYMLHMLALSIWDTFHCCVNVYLLNCSSRFTMIRILTQCKISHLDTFLPLHMPHHDNTTFHHRSHLPWFRSSVIPLASFTHCSWITLQG